MQMNVMNNAMQCHNTKTKLLQKNLDFVLLIQIIMQLLRWAARCDNRYYLHCIWLTSFFVEYHVEEGGVGGGIVLFHSFKQRDF